MRMNTTGVAVAAFALAMASSCAAGVAVPPGLGKGALDKGSMTMDFAEISRSRFEAGVIPSRGDPGNLFSDEVDESLSFRDFGKWHPVAHIHTLDLPPDSAYRRGVKSFARFSNADGVFSAHIGEDFAAYCATSGVANLHRRAEKSWRQTVRLPDAAGGDYRLTFRSKTRHTMPQVNIFQIVLVHALKIGPDGKPTEAGKRQIKAVGFGGSFFEWKPTIFDFAIPQGVDVIEIVIRHDGVGDLICKDMFLTRKPADKSGDPMSLKLSPAQMLDGVFAFGAGQCEMVSWQWRENAPGAFAAKDTTFALTLSPGFEFVGDAFAADVNVEKKADGSSVAVFKVKNSKYFPGRNFQGWDKPSMLLASTGAAGTEGTMSLAAWRGGRKIGDSGAVRLVTLPPVRAVAPEHYLYAAKIGTDSTICFRQEEACARFARHLAEIGVRLLDVHSQKTGSDFKYAATYRREFKAAGGRCMSVGSIIKNGYHLDEGYKTIPPEDKFVAAPDLTKYWSQYVGRDSFCPLTVIEERPTFRDKILPRLKASMEGYDCVRANWEPFMFLDQGCFCGKCRAKFAAHAKVEESELAASWPAIVRANGKYHGKWLRFRSLEHAKMLLVLDRHVKSWVKGDYALGFVAAISWREVCSSWRDLHPSPESEPYDYGSAITTFGSWGPYVKWDAAQPYSYNKRQTLAHFIAARDIRAQTDADYPEGSRPILLGNTQGIQSGAWVCQPEWLGMAMDSFFFNRFAGTQAYFFPEGLDARYEAAYARSSTRAAAYEGAVREGKRKDASVELKPVKEYARPSARVTSYLPKYANEPLLQKVVYERGGARTVAVFNFWEWGEAFFDLCARDLPEGEYVVVDEAGILYAKDSRVASWTAAELARGVRLQVGLCRTRVFEIRPASGASAMKGVAAVLTASDMAAAYEAARPALEKAAAKDAEYEAAEGSRKTVDKKAEV